MMRKKNRKTLVCLLLVLTMLISLYPPAFSEELELEEYETAQYDVQPELLVEEYPYEEEETEIELVPEETPDEIIDTTEGIIYVTDEPVVDIPTEIVEDPVIVDVEPAETVDELDTTTDEPADIDEVGDPADEVILSEDAVIEPADASSTVIVDGAAEKKEASGEENKEAKNEKKDNEDDKDKDDEKREGFPGLPEDYVLTEDMIAARGEMAAHGVADTLAGLTPGIDYVDGELWFLCEDEEYARLVAEAYGATLSSFEYGVATLELDGATVLDAVRAAEDPEQKLPAVSPNYIVNLEPEAELSIQDAATYSAESYTPYSRRSWEYWRDYYGSKFDPYLRDPGSSAEPGSTSAMHYQYMHEMINSYDAWGVTKGSGVWVAVIDSGVAKHSDLPSITRRVVDSGIDKGENPVEAHGTHVAGIIGARLGNGLGGAGIAPEVKLLSIQVLDDRGSGSNATIARGINSARSFGVDIINMSLGGHFWDASLEQAVRNAVNAGITVVCSSGNDNTNIMNYPGTLNIPGLICVGAVTQGRSHGGYSNYGSWVDIWAPGSDIWSTVTGNTYESLNGTSMATPVVAGACALYMGRYGHTDPVTMEKVIKSSVTNGVLDVSKFFDKDTSAPVITVGNLDKKGVAPYNTWMSFEMNPGDTILFTLNGKNPGLDKNGYPNADSYEYTGGSVNLNSKLGITPGKKTTIKAVRVTGMGNVSRAASLTLTIDYAAPTSVSYTDAPGTVGAGKIVTPKAAVLPAEANQTVTWSIYSKSSTAPGVTIDAKTGKLTSKATDSGTVTIRATAAGYPKIYKDLKITIKSVELTKKITLKSGSETVTKLTLHAGGETGTLKATATDRFNNTVSTKFGWSSNNTKVATVSSSGVITPLMKGSTTITCTALDGSNISTRCSVTVVQDVTDIMIIGPASSVEPGRNLMLRTEIYPTTANNKTLSWSVDSSSASAGAVIKNGNLSIPKSYSGNNLITVTATSTDGSNVKASHTVWVSPQAKKVTLSLMSSPKFVGGGITKNNDGTLKSITMYSVEQDYWNGKAKSWKDSEALISASNGDSWADIIWTSSNEDVVRVEPEGTSNGHLYAVGAGNATVTAKSNDAGGRTATLTVKVINPVSSVTVVSSAPAFNSDSSSFNGHDYDRFLGVGKTATNKAILGDAFGNPTNGKVTWTYSVEAYNSSGSSVSSTMLNYIGNCIKLSNSGAISTTSAISSYVNNYDIFVTVKATATEDNSMVSGTCVYYITPLISKLYVQGAYGYDGDRYGLVIGAVANGWYFNDFTVTSSNPKAGTALMEGNILWLYPNNEQLPVDGKTMYSTIKISTCDGSGRTLSLNIGFWSKNHSTSNSGVVTSKVRFGA